MQLFVVRFVRRDLKPDEEYYYSDIEAADEHFGLFLDDDSELYSKIEIVLQTPESERLLKEMKYT